MQHYILVKFNATVTDQAALIARITDLFAQAEQLPGIQGITIRQAVITSDKRYDLMIRMDMAREALAFFDASPIHAQWKESFSPFLAGKVIFDCEA